MYRNGHVNTDEEQLTSIIECNTLSFSKSRKGSIIYGCQPVYMCGGGGDFHFISCVMFDFCGIVNMEKAYISQKRLETNGLKHF